MTSATTSTAPPIVRIEIPWSGTPICRMIRKLPRAGFSGAGGGLVICIARGDGDPTVPGEGDELGFVDDGSSRRFPEGGRLVTGGARVLSSSPQAAGNV